MRFYVVCLQSYDVSKLTDQQIAGYTHTRSLCVYVAIHLAINYVFFTPSPAIICRIHYVFFIFVRLSVYHVQKLCEHNILTTLVGISPNLQF